MRPKCFQMQEQTSCIKVAHNQVSWNPCGSRETRHHGRWCSRQALHLAVSTTGSGCGMPTLMCRGCDGPMYLQKYPSPEKEEEEGVRKMLMCACLFMTATLDA